MAILTTTPILIIITYTANVGYYQYTVKMYTYILSAPDLVPSAIKSNSASYVIALGLLGNPCSIHYTA